MHLYCTSLISVSRLPLLPIYCSCQCTSPGYGNSLLTVLRSVPVSLTGSHPNPLHEGLGIRCSRWWAKPVVSLCCSPAFGGSLFFRAETYSSVSHLCPFGVPSPPPPSLTSPCFHLPAVLDCLGICVCFCTCHSFCLKCSSSPWLTLPYDASFRTLFSLTSLPAQSLHSQNPVCLYFTLCHRHRLFTGMSPLLG